MENYLYFLEVFVDTINFSYTNLDSIPVVKDVIVSTEIGKFVKMDIFSMYEDFMENAEKNMKFNCGKSSLFPCTPANLLKQLEQYPLTIQVIIKNKQIGAVTVNWPKEFIDLIRRSSETFGVIGPVKLNETFIMKNKETNTIAGDIKATIKMSSFGSNIQTNFQKVDADSSKKKFLVRGARGLTTFECQKYRDAGHSSDMLPVSSLYDELSYDEEVTNYQPFEQNIGLSWMALFNSNLTPVESNPFNMQLSSLFGPPGPPGAKMGSPLAGNEQRASTLTFDIISIMERPDENKFLDLRIKPSARGFTVEIDQPPMSISGQLKEKPLTVEEINRKLCKHKDCPAAQKFKEFGIGPLAKNQGLGTVYKPITPHISYGLSQTYGVLDNYGPYGLYVRPKDPNQPFVPKKDDDWAANCWKRKDKPSKEDSNSRCEHPPLRLTGGGVLDFDDVKSPFYECKEIMDQFDEILGKFKSAIGPCGKVTCPFAPNIVQETCKNTCKHPMDFKEENPYQPPPELLNPPSSNAKLPYAAACQSIKCPYAKYKSGLTHEDDCMELQFLPPATSGLCGHPKCPFPIEPDLPPIHWDCPDPLPSGRCKNPECPYLPKDLRCLNEAAQKRAPCGNSECPYALPSSCSSPDCPFADKECPYELNQDCVQCENPDCPYKMNQGDMGYNETCGNPDCPYNIQNDDTCGNPDCPYTQQSDECANPQCPYKMPPEQSCYAPNDNTCANPQCPFAMPQQDPCCMPQMDPCSMPPMDPYAMQSMDPCAMPPMDPYGMPPMDPCAMQSMDPCGMPPCEPVPCPITIDLSCLQQLLNCCLKANVAPPCGQPDCPLGASDVVQICFGGPTCPLNQPPCITEVEEPEAVGDCGNPNCPYAKDPCCAKGAPEEEQDDPNKEITKSKYRASIVLDKKLEPHETAPTEYRSDTRTDIDFAPCNPETCKTYAEGPCDRCHGDGDDDDGPPGDRVRTYRPSLALDKKIEMHEISPTEHRSDTRTDIDNAPCTPQTCKLIKENTCLACSEGARQIQSETGPSKPKKKEKKTVSAPEIRGKAKITKRSKGKYVYSIGDKYPGIQIGHKECVVPSFNVPKRMGWLWNIFTPCMQLKPRRGWRPGGVPKSIAEAIRKHREKQGLRLLELKKFSKRRGYGTYESETSVNVQPRPTLQIKKKDGCYWITMNPLKDPYSLAENEDPYMECTPMQFKITKNKNNVKVKEGENGDYKTCYCGDDGEEVCDDLENASSSSDSELDIEFTPPAGIIHPERFKKKRNVVHCDTQYMASDFEPHKPAGDKKGKKGKKGKKDKGKKGKGKGKGKKGKKK